MKRTGHSDSVDITIETVKPIELESDENASGRLDVSFTLPIYKISLVLAT